MINGAHRLAIAYFLGMEKIPVKVYRSFSFEVPNYTEYIKIQEKNYQRNLSKEKNWFHIHKSKCGDKMYEYWILYVTLKEITYERFFW